MSNVNTAIFRSRSFLGFVINTSMCNTQEIDGNINNKTNIKLVKTFYTRTIDSKTYSCKLHYTHIRTFQ